MASHGSHDGRACPSISLRSIWLAAPTAHFWESNLRPHQPFLLGPKQPWCSGIWWCRLHVLILLFWDKISGQLNESFVFEVNTSLRCCFWSVSLWFINSRSMQLSNYCHQSTPLLKVASRETAWLVLVFKFDRLYVMDLFFWVKSHHVSKLGRTSWLSVTWGRFACPSWAENLTTNPDGFSLASLWLRQIARRWAFLFQVVKLAAVSALAQGLFPRFPANYQAGWGPRGRHRRPIATPSVPDCGSHPNSFLHTAITKWSLPILSC